MSRRGSSLPSSGYPARTPGGYGGMACSPRSWPHLMAGGVAPRIPPCCVLDRGCLAGPGARRGLAGRWWVSLAGGGVVGAPPLVRGSAGEPWGAGGGWLLCLGCVSAPPGHASTRAAPLLPCPPDCTGSPSRAAARMRSAGCPCTPVQGCWPAAGNVGVGGRLTGGMRRTAACTVALAPHLGCCGPLLAGVSLWPGGGIAGSPSPRRAPGCLGGERVWGGTGGAFSLSTSGPPVLLSGGCGGTAVLWLYLVLPTYSGCTINPPPFFFRKHMP